MEDELNRFLKAQESTWQTALNEIKSGQKQTHWIWFIFPQLKGLGQSYTAKYYGINGMKEAQLYLKNDLLKSRLITISEALLQIENKSTHAIFGSPDDMKVRSCMTLFGRADDSIKVFSNVLKKYYDGKEDEKTLKILESKN